MMGLFFPLRIKRKNGIATSKSYQKVKAKHIAYFDILENRIQHNKKLPGFFNQHIFDEISQWQKVWEDDFTEERLKTEWHYTYPNEHNEERLYTLEGDYQVYSHENISPTSQGLVISTCRDEQRGLVWSAKRGFYYHDLPYTSGLVSLSQVLALKEGRLDIEFKISGNPKVEHILWLMSSDKREQINFYQIKDNKANWTVGFKPSPQEAYKKESGHFPMHDIHKRHYNLSFIREGNLLSWYLNGDLVGRHEEVTSLPLCLGFSSHARSEDIGQKAGALSIKSVTFYNRKTEL